MYDYKTLVRQIFTTQCRIVTTLTKKAFQNIVGNEDALASLFPRSLFFFI